MTEQDNSHNPDRLKAFVGNGNPIDDSPSLLLPKKELLRKLHKQHPIEDSVWPLGEDLQSKIRKQIHNGGA